MDSNVDNKKWYILWLNAVQDDETIPYFLSGIDAEIWNPSFSRVNNSGEEQSFQIYPGYYFVRCTAEDTFSIEEKCRKEGYSTVKFLRSDGSGVPIPLTEEEINNIKELDQAKVKLNTDFCVGRRIVIREGPFHDLECEIIDVKEDSVCVQVNIFGRPLEMWFGKGMCSLI